MPSWGHDTLVSPLLAVFGCVATLQTPCESVHDWIPVYSSLLFSWKPMPTHWPGWHETSSITPWIGDAVPPALAAREEAMGSKTATTAAVPSITLASRRRNMLNRTPDVELAFARLRVLVVRIRSPH
jgi:hypothetical protein